MADGYIKPVNSLKQVNTITDKYRFSADQIKELVDSTFACVAYDELKMVVIPIHADEEGFLYDVAWSADACSHSQLTNDRSVFSSITLKPNGSNQFSFF